MNLSKQLLALAQRIEDCRRSKDPRMVAVKPTEIEQALKRMAVEARELELHADQHGSNLSNEYVSEIVTRARWALSNGGASSLVKELANAVLTLAQPNLC